MKTKNALIGTVATVAALGVIGSLGGEADTADTPITGTDTETYAITETVDLTTETAPSITETLALITGTKAPETEPPKPTTKAPETQPPAPVTQAPEQVLKITSVTSPVEAGAMATLTIKGKPNTEYDIKVYYSTKQSDAKGLENKVSSADGTVSWTWKVGSGTKPGTRSITVEGGGEKDKIDFIVTE